MKIPYVSDFIAKIKNRESVSVEQSSFEDGFSVDMDYAESLPEQEQKPVKTTITKEVIEWLEVAVSAITVVIILFSVFFRVVTIVGPSMQNTLHNNDRVVISNFAYEPKQRDIVVISRNIDNSIAGLEQSDEPIIKRVIATGGQTVDIDFKSGTVYVDGKALDEPYISTPTIDSYEVEFPVYVPEGYIFVLGDNRQNSADSRTSRIGENGLIDSRYVLGRAVFRLLPLDRIGALTNE